MGSRVPRVPRARIRQQSVQAMLMHAYCVAQGPISPWLEPPRRLAVATVQAGPIRQDLAWPATQIAACAELVNTKAGLAWQTNLTVCYVGLDATPLAGEARLLDHAAFADLASS